MTTKLVCEGPSETIPGQSFGIEVFPRAICDERSEFQHLEIYQSVSYGKVLVLDGVIQLTERDEFAYHEMIAHVPLAALRRNGKDADIRVLLIGAGDGGALREIVRHAAVSSVTHIEIDRLVVDKCKEHLPNISRNAFADKRVKLEICDGLEFLKKYALEAEKEAERFDLCIVDSGDPSEGPNGTLYQAEFYALVQKCLHPVHGMLCFQSEHIWIHTNLIKTLKTRCDSIFPRVQYFYTQVPSYPGGQIGFLLCSNLASAVLEEGATLDFPSQELKYYTKQVHQASFVLPKCFQDLL